MSLFSGSFWKKLPGILKKVLGILTVIDPAAAAASERGVVATKVAQALAPPAGFNPIPVHTLTADDVRPSLAKFGAALLWIFGILKMVATFVHVITIAPGAESNLNAFIAALPAAVEALFHVKDALMALAAGISIHGLRSAAPGGVVPKSLK